MALNVNGSRFGLVACAILDQALGSLASVGSIIVLLVLVGKYEVGLLLWLLAPTYLFLGIQSALVTSPYLTLVGALDADSRVIKRVVAGRLGVLLVGVCLAVVVGFCVLMRSLGDSRFDLGLVFSFCLGVAGLMLREQQRSFAYAHQEILRALRSTLIYCSLLAVGLVGGVFVFEISAGFVFLMMGAAGLVAALLTFSGWRGPSLGSIRSEVLGYYRLARWAIVGVFFAWVLANSYPIYIEHSFGLLEVAEVGVARLWLMPIALLVPAFINFFRPQIAGKVRSGRYLDARKTISRVSLFVGFACFLPAVLIEILNLFLPLVVIGFKFPPFSYVAAWSVYFFLFSSRSLFQIFMLNDEDGYRRLSLYSFFGFFASMLLLGFIPGDSGYGVVLLMALVEGVLALAVMTSGDKSHQVGSVGG